MFLGILISFFVRTWRSFALLWSFFLSIFSWTPAHRHSRLFFYTVLCITEVYTNLGWIGNNHTPHLCSNSYCGDAPIRVLNSSVFRHVAFPRVASLTKMISFLFFSVGNPRFYFVIDNYCGYLFHFFSYCVNFCDFFIREQLCKNKKY